MTEETPSESIQEQGAEPTTDTKSHLVATPRKSGHETLTELAGDAHITPEKQKPAVEREYIYDDSGNIVDLLFKQDGKSKSLKDVLPGNYILVVAPDKGNHYDPIGNAISYDEDEGGMVDQWEKDFSILHEAGHASDRPRILASAMNYLKNLTIAGIYRSRSWDIDYQKVFEKSGMTPPNSFSDKEEYIDERLKTWTQIDLEQIRAGFGQEAYDALRSDISQAIDEAQSVTSKEEADAENTRYNELIKTHQQRESAEQERTAWAHALLAYRRLKDAGITLYEGSYKDLTDHAEWALASYQKGAPSDVRFMSNAKRIAELQEQSNNSK